MLLTKAHAIGAISRIYGDSLTGFCQGVVDLEIVRISVPTLLRRNNHRNYDNDDEHNEHQRGDERPGALPPCSEALLGWIFLAGRLVTTKP